jgi:hypothetical protein
VQEPIKETMDLLGHNFEEDVVEQNNYNYWQFHKTLNRRPHSSQPDNEPNSVAFLRFVGTLFNRISRVLARHNIKSVGLPHMKLSSLFSPVIDYLGLRTPGVSGSSLSAAESALGRQAVPWTSEKSAIAEHSIDQGHRIQFHNSSILATKTRYMGRIVREAIEIELNSYSIKKEGGFFRSKIMEASCRLPKNFRDMTQTHLATRSCILKSCLQRPSPSQLPPSYGISLCSVAV